MPSSRTKQLLKVTPLLSGTAAFLLLLANPAKTQPGAANGELDLLRWGHWKHPLFAPEPD